MTLVHRRVQFPTEWGEVNVDVDKIHAFSQGDDGRIKVRLGTSLGTEEVGLVTTWEAVQDFLRLVRESKERHG